LTSEAKLRSIVALSDQVFKGINDAHFILLMKLIQLVQQAVYTPVPDSSRTITLFIHASTFAVRMIYHAIEARLRRFKILKSMKVDKLRTLVRTHRPEIAPAIVNGFKKMDLMKALEGVRGLESGSEEHNNDSGTDIFDSFHCPTLMVPFLP